jgi:uncharacterized protein
MPTIDSARAWYPDADPVHGFEHILRVLNMAERLARSEGADIEIVRAAVLLHDATPPARSGANSPQEIPDLRHNHHLASAAFAGDVLRAEGWTEQQVAAVQHCIRAHRFRDNREAPQTLEAQVLFDADKLDAIGAIGVARAVAYAARDGQPFYADPSALFLQSGVKVPGEAHSSYHEYLFKLRKLESRLFTATARSIAHERHAYMASFYRQLAEEIAGQR